MRRAARIDGNQSKIVRAARDLGYRVAITAALGKGFPDIVVFNPRRDILRLIEIKDPAQVPSARALTDDEKAFHAEWGRACAVVETVDDLIEVME